MANTVLEIDSVTFTYWGSDEPALKDISLSIKEGEFVVVLGPTGAGKTTLLMLLNGLIPNIVPGELKGSVKVYDLDTKKHQVYEIAKYVGLVFEDPDSQIVSLTVEDDVAFGPCCMGYSPEEIDKRVEYALSVTRLKGLEKRTTFTLSGGQKQSLAIASVLSLLPSIIVLDEPLSMLDPIGKKMVISILKELTKEGKTIIMAEQNTDLILDMADRIVMMNEGRIVFDGSKEDAVKNIELMNELGIKIPARYILGNCSIFLGMEEDEKPYLSTRVSGDGYAVETIDLVHEYENEVVALRGVTTKIPRGSMTAVIGQNGSGKTTFAKHLCGLLKPTKEESKIYVDEKPINEYPMRELIQKINYVFQNPDDQIFSDTVKQEIEYGLKNLGYPEDRRNKLLSDILNLFGLGEYIDMNPKFLRRGLRCKVAIASIVAMNPDILIVDEPTTGLDYKESLEIMDLLLKLNREENKTIIFITHDMDLVLRYADNVIVFNEGRILLEGAPKDVFRETEILKEAWIDPPEIFQIAVEQGIRDLENIRTPQDLCRRMYGGGE